MKRFHIHLGFALTLLASGCNCGHGPAVPFGLDSGRPAAPTPSPTPGASTEVPEPTPSATPVEVTTLPPGARAAAVEGVQVSLDRDLRALVAIDLDGDGDRDALVYSDATQDPPSPARVQFFAREGSAFSAPRILASLDGPPTCAPADVRAETLASGLMVLHLSASCGEETPRFLATLLIRHGTPGHRTAPRGLERVELRARAGESIALRTEDRDDDGHDDLLVDVRVASSGESTALVTFSFLDRPSGLSRELGEPDAAIAALANEARGHARQRPARAIAIASQAIALHEALCHESGEARLAIGGRELGCGTLRAAGRAYATLVVAHARAGDALQAADAWSHLSAPGIGLRDVDRDFARRELDRIASSAGLVVQEGPEVEAPTLTGTRLSMLAFLDEERLLVRGRTPREIALADGTVTPSARSGELFMRDPDGARRVIGVERRCAGAVLLIGASVPALDSGPASPILFAPRAAPLGATCPDMTPLLRADTDGWVVLGWAPQGVLVARGRALWLVPLDVAGLPTGDAREIEPGAPLPAPVVPGAASANLAFWARASAAGIVVTGLEGERSERLVRPEGYPAEAAAPAGLSGDVAVSPSGRTVAWISSGRVRWATRTAP